MKFEWKGVFPAVTTKFTANDELDFDAFDLNLNAQLEAGVDGIILGGSLGEASTLTQEENTSTASSCLPAGNRSNCARISPFHVAFLGKNTFPMLAMP